MFFINLEHEIYDIGTEILYETCFGHNSTQNAPKSMIPGRIKKSTTFPIIWQSNQDLKHFSKSDLFGFASAVFHGFLPLEGDLTTKLTMQEQLFFMISKTQYLTLGPKFFY